MMKESKLREMFRNLSDCYADTGSFENDGSYIEGEVIQAMTEDRFIELLKETKLLNISSNSKSNIIKPKTRSINDPNAPWNWKKCKDQL